MKRISKVMMLFFLFAETVALSGCGQQKENKIGGNQEVNSEKSYVVGYSNGSQEDEIWHRQMKMLEQFFEDENVKFVYSMASYDQNRQISQCEDLIAEGIDLLILNPVDSVGASTIIDECKNAGVAVVLNRQAVDNSDADCLISLDSVECGRLMARAAKERKPAGNYVILNGDLSSSVAQQLREGIYDELKEEIKSGAIKIVYEQWTENWGLDKAQKLMENALTATKNQVDVVVGANDQIAMGCVNVLKAQNLIDDVTVIGNDGSLNAARSIVKGELYATAWPDLISMNQVLGDTCMAILEGKDTENLGVEYGTWTTYRCSDGKTYPEYDVRILMPQKENLKEILIDSGYQNQEEVYGEQYKSKK